jgi:hypothetical protein
VLPLWQGKQYVAARDDITGTAYALNSASTLQLWELGRGQGLRGSSGSVSHSHRGPGEPCPGAREMLREFSRTDDKAHT